MDDEEETTDGGQSVATRTVTFVPTAGEGETTTPSFTIQEPDIAKTKGRPRMLTIREAIKQNKFYKCSHCGSESHTLKNCTNLDNTTSQKGNKQSSRTQGMSRKVQRTKEATRGATTRGRAI